MSHQRNNTLLAGAFLFSMLWLLCGCNTSRLIARGTNGPAAGEASVSTRSVMSGARVLVALGGSLSSAAVKVGDPWYGTVAEYVMTQGENVIRPGSEVAGVVVHVTPATSGSIAMLELAIRTIRVDGHEESIAASAEPVVAGSWLARSLFADNAGSEGGGTSSQIQLSDTTVMSFTVIQTVAIR